jgi:hypothetical protein
MVFVSIIFLTLLKYDYKVGISLNSIIYPDNMMKIHKKDTLYAERREGT